MSIKGLPDYHIHTAVSIDCDENLFAICKAAADKGLAEIAVTNHMMVTNPDYCITEHELVDLYEECLLMSERFPDMAIRLGLEVDYLEKHLEEINQRIQMYKRAIGQPFDMILGSVHVLRGIHFSSSMKAPALFTQVSPVEAFREYFHTMQDAVDSGLFSIMAHPDLIKKYTNSLHEQVLFKEYAEEAEGFIQSLVSRDVGLELNTKGLDCPVQEIYPSGELLHLYIQEASVNRKEPRITLGSDAHRCENAGRKFAEAKKHMQLAGGKAFVGWKQG